MKNEKIIARSLKDLSDDMFYRFSDLSSILENLNLNYSIYTIRDYETWKCLDYKCNKRHTDAVDACERCGGEVRPAQIISPRTVGGGKGVGHRRYTAREIRDIVAIFQKRT